ncbi:uncharacterized protein BDZ99DRAFT_37925 [Mytilinidion resinicola]|uniref:RING-type domain-containing protein n=1 Tax=Mytilinidion resinicola TaxID=574789 RepID=A0A6A6YIL6_9PEZI|nr:uncharacterized protein BDZ99DRAFT_37925 [Mytilinidion resinicola]KAF2808696.1 hypothetical protein BDZ99DRAFT_37925 [Mytilinidion resinicola]
MCGHMFGSHCLGSWVSRFAVYQANCPQCRRILVAVEVDNEEEEHKVEDGAMRHEVALDDPVPVHPAESDGLETPEDPSDTGDGEYKNSLDLLHVCLVSHD